ncbi:hypothetical protein EST38_g10162 [Candolleomyces aberdarensis]|uniref:Uncharacterized protein n=1 Tax=Candolleomyces aberdarensis TaxID=2316362 RepID=A0A4Q2D8R7_9AGAR|nr:hypothetical protein EST38_g10162 [Candolleomyces aberdarensis]
MSKPGHITRKEAANKKARALARKGQTTFREAMYKTQYPDQPFGPLERTFFVGASGAGDSKKSKKRPTDRGGDIRLGNHSKFFRSDPKETDIDTGMDLVHDLSIDAETDWLYPLEPAKRSNRPMVISLEDVKIHIAKPKGIRKEYDWVDGVQPVIALDDDLSVSSEEEEEEEWEDVYVEKQKLVPSYASVASTKGGG